MFVDSDRKSVFSRYPRKYPRGESNPYQKFRKLMSYSCKSTTCKAFLIFCRTIVELLQFLWKIPCHPKAAEDF